ncbi:putative metalloprotease CJM1_0395 family protein [Syntrophomonas palmitatica]|uniref:putative metalloprotease CJM1_0395 family protein n=1 Tax=Syntrophomonas palmitatica TaxID=402877 RepID=UPI0009F9D0A0|nr:putative metalloprotease CJM1_0395 family protein [Syntrophomonas palmitatica]
MISDRIINSSLIGAYQQGPDKELDKIERVQSGVFKDNVESSEYRKSKPSENKTSGDNLNPKDKLELSGTTQDERELRIIQQLKTIERKVQSHEQAHKAAGGRFTGPISYEYTTGPDGKRYINGGEVPIHAPRGNSPRETVQIMDQVQRAALAPMDPSAQDMAVAAQAGQEKMQASQELSKEIMEKAQQLTQTKSSTGNANEDVTAAKSNDLKPKADKPNMDYSHRLSSTLKMTRESENTSGDNTTKTNAFVEQIRKMVEKVRPGAGTISRILDIVA